MNERLGMTPENLFAAYPLRLKDGKEARAVGKALSALLAGRAPMLEKLLIYPAIDQMGEELLDILAYDFKVDWWNPDYTLEEKRRVLRDSWYVHRHMGTRAAVETALKAVYRDAVILEWFEYGGKPGYFRLWTDVTHEDFIPSLRREILRRMNYYKRLGAHLEAAGYYMKAEPAQAWAYFAYGGQIQKRWAEVTPPPSVGPPEDATTVIYGGVLAGMAGSAERTVAVPETVRPPECRPSSAEARFFHVSEIWKCWDGIIPPPAVGPPKAEVKAVYGGVLAGMAGSAERDIQVPPKAGPPVCKPSCAVAWVGHTALKGRPWIDANLHTGPPGIETTAKYGGALAGMAGALWKAGTGVELGI